MPLGLDKTHKKEKKDRRFAQFNLILGAAADAGKREFNFTTRDKTTTYPWSSLSKISETISWLSQMTPSSIDLCCSATPWRTWRSSLFKEEKESTWCVCVCVYYYKWGKLEEESREEKRRKIWFPSSVVKHVQKDRQKKRRDIHSRLIFINFHYFNTRYERS